MIACWSAAICSIVSFDQSGFEVVIPIPAGPDDHRRVDVAMEERDLLQERRPVRVVVVDGLLEMHHVVREVPVLRRHLASVVNARQRRQHRDQVLGLRLGRIGLEVVSATSQEEPGRDDDRHP
jgi:hypothetical protein